ncbi:DUF2812 domain-containing protein [Virgibacillus natechei]
MVKIFLPFWSYDVEKTEEWLSSVAKQGYHLVKINTWTRQFYFEEGAPKTITYRIGFDAIKVVDMGRCLHRRRSATRALQ